MYNYATSTDSKWRSLLERVEKGDKTASLDMQQFLLNKEIGDLIDLEAFGFGGVLPDVLSKAISSVREQEPLIWNSVLSDPVAKRYLEDPMLAVKEALDVAKDYGEAMMKSL
ncbi:hypothetical protein Naga_101770g1 [Nannochloropsis gaditana]|uniref:Uncharacterized protein n=1 Tax=Nannochloropsis gaditana TaxID=72520 RepID=W7T063_9STRA|nr:hypothetical protein Naga_101770g1 [Nannochloropsis gaditana]